MKAKEKIGQISQHGRAIGIPLAQQYLKGIQDCMYPIKHAVAAFGVQNVITLALWADEIIEMQREREDTTS